jgi:hypothetical protein
MCIRDRPSSARLGSPAGPPARLAQLGSARPPGSARLARLACSAARLLGSRLLARKRHFKSEFSNQFLISLFVFKLFRGKKLLHQQTSFFQARILPFFLGRYFPYIFWCKI